MTKLNETSDIIDLKNDTYALIQVKRENSKEMLAFEQVREKVLDQWTSMEVVNQTKSKLKKLILSKNENLRSNSTIKRNQKSLDNFSDNSLIFNIFLIFGAPPRTLSSLYFDPRIFLLLLVDMAGFSFEKAAKLWGFRPKRSTNTRVMLD